MIKTLKITTLLAAPLAVVFLLLSIAFGLRADPEIEQFLELPGALEQYKAGSAAGAEKTDQSSPLMKQAQAFALRIQPPKPERPVRPTKPAIRPGKVATKFSLLGTAVYVFDPVRSLALIDEPGKGLHWVRRSDNIGHLVIEQINDGHILVRDGERIEPLYAKRPNKKSLLKTVSSAGPPREFKPMRDPSMTKPFDPSQLPPPDNSTRQHRRTRTDTKTPLRPGGLTTSPESMGISPEEARDLDHIGTVLKAMEDKLRHIGKEKPSAAGGQAVPAPNEPNRE